MAEAGMGRGSAAAWLMRAVLLASLASACADESEPSKASNATGAPGGGSGGSAGIAAGMGAMPPAMTGTPSPVGGAPGAGMMAMGTAGAAAAAGSGAGAGAGAGTAGQAGTPANPQAGTGNAGSGGSSGPADAGVDAGAMPEPGTDAMAVCAGGTVGKDSDAMRPPRLNVSREYAGVKMLSPATSPMLSLKTTMEVPAKPTARQTLFIWPGLQNRSGAADPGRVGNGVLQPVLTWGPSCAPKRPSDGYAEWWISGMYVNVTTGAAGATGCAGGDFLSTPVGHLVEIEMREDGNDWVQTMTDLTTMKTVDFTIDLKGQRQNNAMWIVEVPSGSSIRPVADTIFTQNVLTFEKPVQLSTCQPTQAGSTDTFTAPILSKDGLHCCYEKIILKAMR